MQPGLLLGAEHRHRRVERLRAARELAVPAGLVGAVLARVQHAELGEVAPRHAPVEEHGAVARPRRRSQRDVLVESLVGGRAPRGELRVRLAALRGQSGVVVLNLVVVPRDHPWEALVGALEVGVGLVQRVLQPVALERHALGAELLRDRHVAEPAVCVDAVFVDVVTEVHDELEILLGKPPVRRVVALVPALAGGEREGERVDRGPARRGGHGSPDRTELVAVAELEEVLAARLEAVHLDVDRVRELGHRERDAGAHHAPHPRILGHAPHDRRPAMRHAAVRLERLRCEPGPQDDPGGRRVPRRNAEGERIAAQARRRVGEIAAHLAERGGAGERSGELKETAAVHRSGQRLLERLEGIGHCDLRSRGAAAARWRGDPFRALLGRQLYPPREAQSSPETA